MRGKMVNKTNNKHGTGLNLWNGQSKPDIGQDVRAVASWLKNTVEYIRLRQNQKGFKRAPVDAENPYSLPARTEEIVMYKAGTKREISERELKKETLDLIPEIMELVAAGHIGLDSKTGGYFFTPKGIEFHYPVRGERGGGTFRRQRETIRRENARRRIYTQLANGTTSPRDHPGYQRPTH